MNKQPRAKVLQGYFRLERARPPQARPRAALPGMGQVAPQRPEPRLLAGQARRAAPAPSRAPRPELLPPAMRAGAAAPRPGAAQPRGAAGLPHPERLPSLTRAAGPPRGAQMRELRATPLPAGQLRLVDPGRPLAADVRRPLESFFGADFSTVRVHEGPAATAIGAIAFTLGEHIYFAPGQFDPRSPQGLALLGHELTHVVQQRAGRVENPYGGGVAVVQDAALEVEADRMGQRLSEHHARSVGRRAITPYTPREGSLRPGPTGAVQPSSTGSSKYADTDTNESGQIYGIWENEQYPNKIKASSLDPDKCLYIGKTARGEDLGGRFVEHVKLDKLAPWYLGKGNDYSAEDDDGWPYVVRNIWLFNGLTKMDVAVAEQYYMQDYLQQGAKILNRRNEISPEKFELYKNAGAWTTKGQYPKTWKPIDVMKL